MENHENRSRQRETQNQRNKVFQIAGVWVKVDQEDSPYTFPDRIIFKETIYLAELDNPQDFSIWQSGDFEILKDGKIKLQDARDAMRTYEYRVSEDQNTISIRIDEQYEVTYLRLNK